jgi:hypothetical protein
MRIEDMIRKTIREILEEEEARKKNAGIDRAEPDPDEDDFTREDTEEEQKPRISYMLKVLPEANTPKEWHPGEEVQTGIECDGYVILTFKDGKPKNEIIMNVDTEQIKVALREGRSGAKLIRAGAIMADAEIKAMGMEREAEIAVRAHAQIERIKQLVEEHDRRHKHDEEDEEDD